MAPGNEPSVRAPHRHHTYNDHWQGLNVQLKACNNVILVDIWWNPALGDQAFDRAHQTRVSTYKLTIENTVEERILTLEDSKRALATAALGGDKIENLKLGQALMALFRSGRGDDDN